jgi:RNA polymerase sigma-70 factor (ECF subfamily)
VIDWEGIVRENGPAVWRTAQRLLANHADADECFQETFVAAVQWVRSHAQPVHNWRGMLVRLATTRAVDRLRRRVRRTKHETGDGTDVAALPDRHVDSRPADRAEQAEMSARLREALTHLPPKQADAFCLHCLEGFSYREVAEHLGESVDHVGVLIHRARAALKERIAALIPDEAMPGAAAESGAESRRVRSQVRSQEVPHEQQ